MQSDLHDTLHEGIPAWMDQPFWDWMDVAQTEAAAAMADPGQPPSRVDLAQEYDQLTRAATPIAPRVRSGYSLPGTVRGRENDDEALRLADFFIYKMSAISRTTVPDDLERIFVSCGSAWTVGTRGASKGLQRRVPEGVQLAAQEIISSAGTAGQLLAEAWHAAYGRTPDTEEAYEKAIKAVEQSGAANVSPNNQRATLGTMVRDMKAQGDWKLPLGSAEADVPLRMAEALWQGQESRHGGNGYRKPTQAEAESAVSLAVVLVQAFTAGLLARRP